MNELQGHKNEKKENDTITFYFSDENFIEGSGALRGGWETVKVIRNKIIVSMENISIDKKRNSQNSKISSGRSK